MNPLRITFIGAVATLAVAATALAQDAVSIVWKPKVGQTMKYRMTSTSDMNGQSTEFGNVLTSTVKEIRADGKVVIVSKTGEMSLKVGGQDMSAMIPPMDAAVTTVSLPNGEMVSRTLDKPSEIDLPRLENAFVFLYPDKSVKGGESWTRKHGGDAKAGVPASTTTFTYRGVEKTDGGLSAHKIEFDFKETGANPITGTGTAWVAVEDGALLKAEFSMKNVPVAEGMPSVDMKGQVVRTGVEG